jgi:hypothetical protein
MVNFMSLQSVQTLKIPIIHYSLSVICVIFIVGFPPGPEPELKISGLVKIHERMDASVHPVFSEEERLRTMSRIKSNSESIVTIDRRQAERRSKAVAEKATPKTTLEPRRKVQRRRQIDPTTCEREYTAEELEFMNAIEAYKRSSGRMFPTCSEVLEVIRHLGYSRSNAPSSNSVANPS